MPLQDANLTPSIGGFGFSFLPRVHEGSVVEHLFQVHGQLLGVAMPPYFAAGRAPKHVPLHVRAFGVLVLGECLIQSNGVMAGDGLVHDEFGV